MSPLIPFPTAAALLLWMLLLAGCQSHSTPLPVTAADNTARLIQRADFPLAARAAPDWCKDALRTITRLETDLANHTP